MRLNPLGIGVQAAFADGLRRGRHDAGEVFREYLPQNVRFQPQTLSGNLPHAERLAARQRVRHQIDAGARAAEHDVHVLVRHVGAKHQTVAVFAEERAPAVRILHEVHVHLVARREIQRKTLKGIQQALGVRAIVGGEIQVRQ